MTEIAENCNEISITVIVACVMTVLLTALYVYLSMRHWHKKIGDDDYKGVV